jgi:hypothetical protein
MPEAPENLKAHIAERARLLEKHFADGDIAALVRDFYVPDALEPIVSGGDKAVIGRTGIAALLEGLVEPFSAIRQVPLTIRVDSETAYEVSNAYFTPRQGGDEVPFRYLAVWRRCDDCWRVEADFFAPGQV